MGGFSPDAQLSARVVELELIQSHMAQKPMLRGEVGARAVRVRSDVRGHGQVRLCKVPGCGRCGCLKPIRACCVVGCHEYISGDTLSRAPKNSPSKPR